MTLSPSTIGDMLCSVAARGNVTRLTSFYYAGADLNQPDVSNRTPLYVAVLHNQVRELDAFLYQLMTNLRLTLQEECVDYLLHHEAAVDFCDDLGHSALDVARMLNREELLKKLEEQNRKLSDERHTGL